jgi:hypothetical protein
VLTIEEYLCGLTPTLRENAETIVEKANKFLEAAANDGIPSYSPVLASGWRPDRYNHLIPNSAKKSRHITCEAVDLRDPDGFLAAFAKRRIDLLEELGLYMEDPRYTPKWVHLQTRAVPSGNRIFIPYRSPQ